jgi:hypothetical protein
MPSNWSFNQVKEFSFSASGDTFDLDNDVCRGTGDRGAGPENVGDTSTDLGSVIDDDGSLNDDSDPPDPSLPLSSFEGA